MTCFSDITGRSWTVEFDGLLLGDVRDREKIDLTRGGEWAKLESDEPSLLRVLVIVCGELLAERQLTPRQFSKAITGDVLSQAIEAVRGAASAFFPQKRWSEIQSSCTAQKSLEESMAAIRPLLRLLADPDMPEAMAQSVMLAVTEKIHQIGSTGSKSSTDNRSVSGPGAIPSSPAFDSPASSVSTPAA